MPSTRKELVFQSQGTQFDREVRLAVVLYGGISLAVYMNGVSHELYRITRGRGAYGFLKMLIDSDVVPDVISGTSAGGMNGVFLAFSLLNNGTNHEPFSFERYAEVWRKHADVDEITQFEPPDPIRSLFNGEDYQRQLEAIFQPDQKIEESLQDSAIVDDIPSEISELDLFITGTNLAGSGHYQYDSAGYRELYTDHLVRFHLKHRNDGKGGARRRDLLREDAQEGGTNGAKKVSEKVKALAKLCRITSCIPPAFAPLDVAVKRDLGTPGEADDYLLQWAMQGGYRLSDPLEEMDGFEINQRKLFLSDGGTMDNRPFGPAVRQIKYRLADRPIDRKLLYIDPMSEQIGTDINKRPDMIKVLFDAGSGIPRYKNIADNTDELRQHNLDIFRYWEQLGALNKAFKSGLNPTINDEHRQGRFLMALDVLKNLRIGTRAERFMACDRSDFWGLVLLGKGKDRTAAQYPVRARYDKLDFSTIDYAYASRFAFFVAERLYERILNGSANPQTRSALKVVNDVIELIQVLEGRIKLDLGRLERLEDPGEALLEVIDEYYRKTPRSLEEAHRVLIDEGLEEEAKTSAERALAVLMDYACSREGLRESEPPNATVLNWIEDFLRSLAKKEFDGEVMREVEAYENIDYLLLPSFVNNRCLEAGQIERYLFSADSKDQTYGYGEGMSAARKLAGDDFMAFAGFFEKSWRSNDILWGRLDAVYDLVQALVTPESILHFRDFWKRHSAGLKSYVMDRSRNSSRSDADTSSFFELLLRSMLDHVDDAANLREAARLLERVVAGEESGNSAVDALRRVLVTQLQREVLLSGALERALDDRLNAPHLKADKELSRHVRSQKADLTNSRFSIAVLDQVMNGYPFPPSDPMSQLRPRFKLTLLWRTLGNVARSQDFLPEWLEKLIRPLLFLCMPFLRLRYVVGSWGLLGKGLEWGIKILFFAWIIVVALLPVAGLVAILKRMPY